jgi:hypothetical protein
MNALLWPACTQPSVPQTRNLPHPAPMLPVGRSLDNDGPFVLLGTVPLVFVAIEVVVACVLGFVAVCFFATIYLAFVGLLLFYIALWLGVAFHVAGTLWGAAATVVGRRHPVALGMSLAGLALNGAMLAGAVYGLMQFHGW